MLFSTRHGDMSIPRVSVSLPVFNGEQFVAHAIQSVLDQDFADFELIITDNQSTDRTEDICRGFAEQDRRVRYVRNERNLGAGGNFNRGFELARGEFFKWIAHDDLISPSYLRLGVERLEQDPAATVAYGNLTLIDSSGHLIDAEGSLDKRYREANRILPDMARLSPHDRFRLMLDYGWSDNAIFGVIRSSMLKNGSLHKPYFGSDCVLLAELALRGPFIFVPEMVLFNRDHPSRSTRISKKEDRSVWHSPSLKGAQALEHWPRLRHQLQVAVGHRSLAPAYKTLPVVMRWAVRPKRIAWLGLEMIGMVSPALRRKLSDGTRAGLRIAKRLRGA